MELSNRWEKKMPSIKPTMPPKNPFLRALSSPLRVDRSTKLIKVPRDLLMTFSTFKNREDGKLWLIPNVEGFKSGLSNGYGPNYYSWLSRMKAKKWVSLASLELLSNSSNITNIQDVNWNERNPELINELYCKVISQCDYTVIDDTLPMRIVCDEHHGLLTVSKDLIIVNLDKVDLDIGQFKQLKQELDGQILQNSKAIDAILKFIAYNRHRPI